MGIRNGREVLEGLRDSRAIYMTDLQEAFEKMMQKVDNRDEHRWTKKKGRRQPRIHER